MKEKFSAYEKEEGMKILFGKLNAALWVVLVMLSLSTVVFSQNIHYRGDEEQNAWLKAKSQALAANLQAPAGQRYTAIVPNTLDLTAHAALGLNGLSGILDPKTNYEFWWRISYNKCTPTLYYDVLSALSFAACGMKILESFPMMMTMTGSDEYNESFNGLKNLLVSWIDADGLLYCPVGPERPWDTVAPEDYANVYGQSRMMLAMMALYQLDGNKAWLELIAKTSDALCRIAIDKGDYAYYPVNKGNDKVEVKEGYCYPRSGWYDTSEAENEAEGREGSMFVYHQGQIRALSHWYTISGDKRALEMARKLVNYVTKEKFWGTPFDGPGSRDDGFDLCGWRPRAVGHERAHFMGHFHGHAAMLFALAEYANAVNDTRMKEFVRSGYEFARNFGIARVGLFGESCTTMDMIGTAIKLTEGGAGDYWDDVDGYIRNQMIEQQLTDPDELLKVCRLSCTEGTPPNGETVTIARIKQTLGIYCNIGDLGQIPHTYSIQCCTGNGTEALYYAWESIVRKCGEDGVQINLLLNRASPWIDIDSYLPYEGKVALRNKTARWLSFRSPVWVDHKEVKCSVNGKERTPSWIANYARIDDLHPKDEIVFTFPMNEETVNYTVLTEQQWTSDSREAKNPPDSTITFKCTFKGNTLVDFSPRPDDRWYLNYKRDHYKKDKAPMKEVRRYVTPDIIMW